MTPILVSTLTIVGAAIATIGFFENNPKETPLHSSNLVATLIMLLGAVIGAVGVGIALGKAPLDTCPHGQIRVTTEKYHGCVDPKDIAPHLHKEIELEP